ncbi:MAG: RNA polymerase sigma factor [Candidatus Nanopelagicales bacterium]
MSQTSAGDNVIFPDFGGLAEVEEISELEFSGPVSVKSWTSEDFAKVYVRYRPRLESYARKFLRDQTEIDEVIQDAFMYLFLSQPELDSEIGVLKFLQWKTRLLCLDIIRVQGRRPLTVLDDTENYDFKLKATDSPADEYEKMFDVAIVHAALSRIPDRQREALIRAEFGEQSAAQIGQDLGVSENAVRQLLMRARRSFRTELLEQVNIAGIDISEVLSVAVRKAKEVSKNAGAMIIALLLPIAVTLGFQYVSSNSGGVSIVEPEFSSSIIPSNTPSSSPIEDPSVTPDDVETTTPSSKPSSDEGQSFANGVISRKSSVVQTSPTLIMSQYPLNADGLILTSDESNVTTALITSLEGDKVEIIISRDQAKIDIHFRFLARGSNTWIDPEFLQVERSLTSSGGLVLNATFKDSEGKVWGVTSTFASEFTSVLNARIVSI